MVDPLRSQCPLQGLLADLIPNQCLLLHPLRTRHPALARVVSVWLRIGTHCPGAAFYVGGAAIGMSHTVVALGRICYSVVCE
jgi:hypothetical protein